MKKNTFLKTRIFAFLISLICLAACDNTGETSTSIYDRQFVFENSDIVMRIDIGSKSSSDGYVTIYSKERNGEYVYQDADNVYHSGEYPELMLSSTEKRNGRETGQNFSMSLKFSTSDRFVATVLSQSLNYGIALPLTMEFNYSDKTLDINGDGVLDSYQDL